MNIKTAGVFFRPQDTPAGKKGWWVEILFSYPWYVKSEDKFDISKRFATKEEADEFYRQEIKRLHDLDIL